MRSTHPMKPGRATSGVLVALGVGLAAAFALAAAAPSRAAESIAMNWTSCALDGGPASRFFDCTSDLTDHVLVVSASAGVPVDSVLGFEAELAMQASGSTLPDWWRTQPGGCRPGQIEADVAFGPSSACLDPLLGNGVALFQSLVQGEPRGLPSQAKLLASAGVPSNQPGTLDAGPVYDIVRVVVHSGGTLSGTCSGCSDAVCLVLNEVRVLYLAQGVVQTLRLTAPAGGNGNWVGWQSNPGASCQAVPVRSASWGALKSLYR